MNKKKSYLLHAFGINLFLAVLVFAFFIIKGKGTFSLFADFNNQQIPFNMLANTAIKRGEIGWNWNIDLGANFIGAFSFYNLGSPFFWITLFTKASNFQYVVGIIYILKYAVAGLTSYMYIELFVKDKKAALLGSIFYAFSGFQSANLLFYHFHDVVAFFPLLLYGLEVLICEKRKRVLALAVCVNALLNYFFFFGEVVFVILYFFVRFGEKKGILIRIWNCLKEGILGVGMAGGLFLPSIAFVLQNPRVGEKISGKAMFVFDWKKYFQILRAMFFPGENMSFQSSVYSGEWSSCAAYLPMVGMVLVLAFVIIKKKSWLSKMLVMSALIAFVPVLSSVFYLFNAMVYQRWFYMPILLMSLASAIVIEERDKYPIKLSAKITGAIICVITFFIWIYRDGDGSSIVYRPRLFWLLFFIAASGVVVTYVLLTKVKDKNLMRCMFCCVGVFAVLTTFLNCFLYQRSASCTSQILQKELQGNQKIESKDEKYRFICEDNLINMVAPIAGTGSWCSTVGGGIFEFYESLGVNRFIDTPETPDGTKELLAGKYYITMNEASKIYPYIEQEMVNVQIEDIKEIETVNAIESKVIYELDETLPLGITYETYMTKSEYQKIALEDRALAMIKTLVVPDELETEVSEVLRKYSVEEDGAICSENKKSDINEHLKECSEVFRRSKHGFFSTIQSNESKYAFYSVPYDRGWRATVNGKKVEIMDVNGLMAVPIEKGDNEIRFIYEVPMLKIGVGVSLISIMFLLVGILIEVKKKRLVKGETDCNQNMIRKGKVK